MKFKTKEELIADKYNHGIGLAYQNGEESGIIIAFKSFAERVKFYKKYRLTYDEDTSGMIFLQNDYKEIYEEYRKANYDYNLWLFDYCFGDVIE